MLYRGKIKGNAIEFECGLPYEEGIDVCVIVESLDEDLRPGVPADIVRMVLESPHISDEDIEALERSIEDGKSPPSKGWSFDEP